MKKLLLFCFISLFSLALFSQVGIGTTTPSDAAMLEVSSVTASGDYKGFMPPVMTIAQRDLINVTNADVGLLVFINDSVEGVQCLQFYTGSGWECANNASATGFTVFAAQDFDSNTTWNFTLNPATYNVPASNDIWSVVNSLDNITGFTGNFFGCQDLNNPNGGGNFDHTIAFENIDISAATNPRISFDYDIFGFDNGDDVFYELFYDDVSQGTFILLEGVNGGGATLSGTETINIPGGTTNVRLTLSISQNGDADTAGFDNFRVFE